MHYEIKAIVRQ